MDLNFRTQNKEYLNALKKAIIEGAKDPYAAWQCVHNQLYLDDMINHMRSLSLSLVIPGTGNIVSDIVFLVPSAFDNTIAELKNVLRSNNISPDSVWITSIEKAQDIPLNMAKKYTSMEIDQINPRLIITFGVEDVFSNSLISPKRLVLCPNVSTITDCVKTAIPYCKQIRPVIK